MKIKEFSKGTHVAIVDEFLNAPVFKRAFSLYETGILSDLTAIRHYNLAFLIARSIDSNRDKKYSLGIYDRRTGFNMEMHHEISHNKQQVINIVKYRFTKLGKLLG